MKTPFIFQLFARLIHKGQLSLCIGIFDRDQAWTASGKEEGQTVNITLSSQGDLWPMIFRPEMGIAEAYMDGRLCLADTSIDDFIIFLFDNKQALSVTKFGRFFNYIVQIKAFLKSAIGRRMAQRNVSHHYDIKDDLYELFLDHRRQYSCGYFLSPHDDIHTAQIQKIARIAAKLKLKDGAQILDIGCGWGELSYALSTLENNIFTHGITLSKNQWDYACKKVASRAPSQVHFSLQDYRDEHQKYDHIVSVGMIEHVGHKALNDYCKVISRCLEETGIALLHFIGKRRASKGHSPFINKYIFPGGYIPTLADMTSALSKTDLHITDVECWHNHYAETLRQWRLRCETHKEHIISTFDERFWRMWLFYLVSCEYFFRLDEGVVYQIQLAKTRDVTPSTRYYIAEKEKRYTKKLWQQNKLFGNPPP